MGVHTALWSARDVLISLIVGDTTKKTSNGDSAPVMTREDSKFEATKHLYSTASRLNNTVNVLEEYCQVFSDKSSSRAKITQKSQHLKKYILPPLSHFTDTLIMLHGKSWLLLPPSSMCMIAMKSNL